MIEQVKTEQPTEQSIEQPNEDTKFVLLEGIRLGNQFFTGYAKGEDPTTSAKGEKWYKVLGYASTVEEAQTKLYGKPFPTPLKSEYVTRSGKRVVNVHLERFNSLGSQLPPPKGGRLVSHSFDYTLVFPIEN
jgi:hypothetical protein